MLGKTAVSGVTGYVDVSMSDNSQQTWLVVGSMTANVAQRCFFNFGGTAGVYSQHFGDSLFTVSGATTQTLELDNAEPFIMIIRGGAAGGGANTGRIRVVADGVAPYDEDVNFNDIGNNTFARLLTVSGASHAENWLSDMSWWARWNNHVSNTDFLTISSVAETYFGITPA